MQPLANSTSGPAADRKIENTNASARECAETITEQDLRPFVASLMQRNFAYPSEKPRVFVKYAHKSHHSKQAGVRAQADMQRLAWEWLRDERHRGNNHGIRVPEVYRVFEGDVSAEWGSFIEFLIMELLPDTYSMFGDFVNEQPDPDAAHVQCIDQIANAIQLFRQIPVPTDATPGPFTSDSRIIRHCMFQDQKAYIPFVSVDELQDYVNRVASSIYRARIKRGQTPSRLPPTAEFEQELEYCYTDFNDENFMFCRDPEDQFRYSLCVVDFEHASFLPRSFLAYAIKHGRFLASELDLRIPLPEKNLLAMLQAACLLVQGGGSLGLTDEQKQRNAGG